MVTTAIKQQLNRLNSLFYKYQIGKEMDQSPKVVAFEYSFASDGGAAGDVTFTVTAPEDAIVYKLMAHETTALTSGGAATVTLKCGSVSLTDALAFDTGFTGIDDLALASSAEGIAITSGDSFKITIATAALTAGVVRFYVFMVPKRTNT